MYEEVKQFLSKPYRISHRIEQLEITKHEYEILSNSIPGGNYDQPVVQKTRDLKAPFVKWIDKKMEVESKIRELEEELNKVKAEVLAAIEKVQNQDYRNVLIMRYLNNCTWEDICSKLYVSLSTVKRWHWDALSYVEIKDEP